MMFFYSVFSSRSYFLKIGGKITLFLLGCGFVLFVNGALPFIGLPTLGQAVWTTGFSQSFVNDSIFSIYAQNFGAPRPAAMAFGLAGAWLAGLFIVFGAHPADAYALMVVFWLCIAFYGAYKWARFMGGAFNLSILAAIAWGTMPIVWNHAGYSMLSLGIALLPAYFLAAMRLFIQPSTNVWAITFIYLLVCIIAIFMDGYSFMMFATGASITWCALFFAKKSEKIKFIIHAACLISSYLLFSLYIGKNQYESESMDFFRGWGADVTFFFMPSAGVHWVADLIGFSAPRSVDRYFGDESVWVTTFCLPLVAAATLIAFFLKGRIKFVIIVLALFGFYMALGPSLKFNSIKPAAETSSVMNSKYALMPTGSAFLSESIPGFKNMRAAYRWVALGVFGSWAIIILGLSKIQPKGVMATAFISLILVVILNLPNLRERYDIYKSYRDQFMKIDSDLVSGMGNYVRHGEKVVFLPWRNDFLVNYLASRLKITSYNIGGDKNFREAKKYWPSLLRDIPIGSVGEDLHVRVILLLMQGDADVVVLPYIDMLWAAHRWPYPVIKGDSIREKVEELRGSGYVDVFEEGYYAVIRLKPKYSSLDNRQEIIREIKGLYCFETDCLRVSKFSRSTLTQVGDLQGDVLMTTGVSGFLHYGPYKSINKGAYILCVNGVANNPSRAWVDVVSDKGRVTHGRFAIHQSMRMHQSLLVCESIHLSDRVDDIEVRVYVDADAEVLLTGYSLLSVQ